LPCHRFDVLVGHRTDQGKGARHPQRWTFRLRENYTLGCLLAFLDRYKDKSATLYVDNKYYLDVLQQWVKHPRIKMIHQKHDREPPDTLSAPFIVYVDNTITDG